MENLIELKPGIILRGITEKQYKKLESITATSPKAIKANVSMPDCGFITIELFFRKITELDDKKYLEQYVEFKRNFIKLENQPLIRYSYFNYAKNRYETKTEHMDYEHIGALNSIKTALTQIQPSYAYIIATKRETDVANTIS